MNRYPRLALAFAALLVVIILAADLGLAQEFFATVNRVPGGDTTGHFVLLGLLSLLVNLGFSSTRLGRLPLHKASLLLAAIITVEEFTQILLANRTFSLTDLSANYLGIWLLGELGVFLRSQVLSNYNLGME